MSARSVSSLIAAGSSPSARWLSYSSRAASCAARSGPSARLSNIAGLLLTERARAHGVRRPALAGREMTGSFRGHAGAKGVKRAARPLDTAGAASRTAQTTLPGVPSSAGYQPHRSLMASTSSRPRPLSSSSPGIPGPRDAAAEVADEDGQFALVQGEDQPDSEAAPSRREASSAFVTSS